MSRGTAQFPQATRHCRRQPTQTRCAAALRRRTVGKTRLCEYEIVPKFGWKQCQTRPHVGGETRSTVPCTCRPGTHESTFAQIGCMKRTRWHAAVMIIPVYLSPVCADCIKNVRLDARVPKIRPPPCAQMAVCVCSFAHSLTTKRRLTETQDCTRYHASGVSVYETSARPP